MSKSPVYIGAGSSALTTASAQNIIDNANDISLQLQTVEEWVTLTDGTTVFDFVGNAQTTEYSAKEYAQGTAATGGTAKQWALGGGSHVEATAVTGSSYSARKYASNAAASAALAEGYTDAFDDKYLGSHTTDYREAAAQGNVGKDNDGDALDDGALYYDTTLEIMKVWDDTGSVWKQLTPSSSQQTNIDLVVANPLATNIGLVAAIDGNVTKVADIDGNVTKVADIDDDVTDVANIDTNVTTVAGKDTEIGRIGTAPMAASIALIGTAPMANSTDGDIKVVADNNANVTKVANIDGDVTKVADITTGNVTKVADVDAEVVRLGVDIHTTASTGNLARLGTAAMATASTGHLAYLGTSAMANTTDGYLKVLGNATVTADLAILGDTDITDDMALLGATGVIGDIEIVSDNISNVSNFADLYQIDDFSPVPTKDGGGVDNLAKGDLAFDTTDDVLRVYNGSAWSSGVNTTDGVIVKQEYTANGSTQHFALSHDQDMEIVYLNGVKLLSGDGSNNNDYFSVNGGSSTTYVGNGNASTHIYFHTAPTNTFVISFVAWGASSNTLAISKSGGTYSGAVTFSAGLITNTADINGGTLAAITIDGAWTAASQTCADLGTVTTANIDGGTWNGTIDGAWTAASQTCADLGTVTTANIDGGTVDGIATLGVGTAPVAFGSGNKVYVYGDASLASTQPGIVIIDAKLDTHARNWGFYNGASGSGELSLRTSLISHNSAPTSTQANPYGNKVALTITKDAATVEITEDLTVGGTLDVTGAITGNASTATALATTRAINGVNFDGSAAITVTADANTLSSTTLKNTVVTSSLTSLGTLTSLTGGTGDFKWSNAGGGATLFADYSENKVGIGIDSPDAKLEIYGSASGLEPESHLKLRAQTSDGDYLGILFSAYGGSTGKGWFGFERRPASGSGGGDFVFLLDSASNNDDLETSDQVMRIANNGNVTGTHGNYHTSSDERLKENIEIIPDALEKINAIKGVTFDFLESEGILGKQAGVIAQDLEAAGMSPVVHIREETEEKYKSVQDGNQLNAYLIEAIKELSAKVKALEAA